MASSLIRSTPVTLNDTFYYENEPVLSYQISYPHFRSQTSSEVLNIINRYYEEKAFLLARYCSTVLCAQAAEQYQASRKKGLPFFPYEVIRKYQIELINDCYLSQSAELYVYTGGAHGQTALFSNVWNLKDGSILLLKDFFPNRPGYKKEIMQSIIRYISGQNSKSGADSLYFGDEKRNVVNTFNENNYYLTNDGIVIYFQPYDIAPHSTGIPRFLIPGDAADCKSQE